MNQKITLILCIFLSINAFSQGNYELGKVTLSELQESKYAKDTTVSAVVLFQVGKTYFEFSQDKGFELVTEMDTKIKIYTEEGLIYAKQNLNYYKGETAAETGVVTKGMTYSLVDDEMVKTNLKSEDVVIDNKNKYWLQKKITFKNAKPGSIIEYRVITRSPFVSNFPEWAFQRAIPVLHSEYSASIPEYFTYVVAFKGDVAPLVAIEKSNKTITINEMEKTKPESVFYSASKKSPNTFTYEETKATYTVDDIPALQDDPFVNNIDNYRAAVTHDLSSKKLADGTVESYKADWGTVVKKIYDSENFGAQLNKTAYFEHDLNVSLRGVAAGEDKLNAIFKFVKTRMTWNGTSSYFCDSDIESVYGGATTGNSAEINLMLTAMLRYGGFDANPVLISTRTHGVYSFPSRSAFNYVIVAVNFNGSRMFLDATSKYAPFNFVAIEALNGTGRLVKKDGTSIEVDVMPKFKSKQIVNLMAAIDYMGGVKAKVATQYLDYNIFSFKENNTGMTQQSRVKMLEDMSTGIEIEDYIYINNPDLSTPAEERYIVTDSNSGEVNDTQISFPPLLFFAEDKNPFIKETRNYPADFVFPQEDEFNVNIIFPKSYKVVSLPESKTVEMPKNLGSFKYDISTKEDQIDLHFTTDFNQAIITPEDYSILKNFYKEMIGKENEKIVIMKEQ